MKSELELPRFWFVMLALSLVAPIAVPPAAAAQANTQTQPAAAAANGQTPPTCTAPPATSADQGAAATAATAASTVSKAANSISNLGSIFGKKKAAQNAGQVANVAGGCDAKVNAATTDVGTVVGTAKTVGSAANSSSAGSAATAAPAPNSSAAAQPTNSLAPLQPQANSAVYVPPSNAPAAFTGPLDSSKLPDISGVHLGMTLADAKVALQKVYPSSSIAAMGGTPIGPKPQVFTGLLHVAGDNVGEAGVDLTLPPDPQLVWHMARNTPQPHVAHNVLVAALRQKYGKESYATGPAQAATTNDSAIQQMWWVFDEQGQPVSKVQIISSSPYGCGNAGSTNSTALSGGYYSSLMRDTSSLSTYCASSYVGVLATMTNQPIVDNLVLDIVDLALVVRSAKATDAWSKAEFDKARQQDIQKSNQVKPAL